MKKIEDLVHYNCMKKHLLLFFFFLISFCVRPFLFGNDAAGKVVRIPFYEGTLSSERKSVNPADDYYYEFMMDIADYYGWTFEYYTTKSILSSYYALERGSFDLLYNVFVKPEWHECGLKYSIFPSGKEDVVVLVREDDNRFSMTNINALDGKNIGYEAGDPNLLDKLEQFEKDNGINPGRNYFGTQLQMLTLLYEGFIDACVIRAGGIVPATKIIYTLDSELVYFASFDQDLIYDIDYYISLKSLEDPFYYSDLFMRNYVNRSGSAQNFTNEELEFLKNEDNSFVFYTNDPDSLNSLSFVKKDFCKKISDISGVNIDIKNILYKSKAEDSSALCFYETFSSYGKKNGKLSSGNYFYYSSPVYEKSVRLITEDIATGKDSAKKKEAPDKQIILETTMDLVKVVPFFMEKYPTMQVKDVVVRDNTEKCLLDLEHGKCSVVLVNEFYLTQKYQLSDFNLQNNETELFSIPISIVAEAGDEEKVKIAASIVDKVVQHIPEGYYKELLSAQGLNEKYSPPVNKKLIRIFFIVVIFIVIILTHSYVITIMHSRKYKEMAMKDALTGSLSAAGYEARLYNALVGKSENNIIILEFNIRGFSSLNKLHGTNMGDKVLIELANLLKKDFGEKNVCRSYGDSFYVFKVSSDSKEKLIEEIYRKQQSLQEELTALMQFRIVIKTGMVFGPEEIFDAKAEVKNLMSCANYARSKKGSSMIDNFSLFDEDLLKRREDESRIDACIENALKEEEFFVVYQPKIDISSGKIRGAESLVRWKLRNGTVLYPDRFIEILEKNGYIEKLDFYVYRKTFEFMQQLLDNGEPLVPISLNVSRMCYNALEFVDRFYNLFSEFNIPAHFVELEIEERFTAESADDNIGEMTNLLKRVGFRVSMDDFGTGQSSLNMLSEIPVDIIKFDRAFLRRAETSEESRVILRSLIQMMKNLGKTVLCEGVETSEQISILKDMKCDLVQGYYYSKPLTVDAFTTYLKEHY